MSGLRIVEATWCPSGPISVMPVVALVEESDSVGVYLHICSGLGEVRRQRGVDGASDQDCFEWRWTASRKFSARTAYLAFFEGSTVMPGAPQVWHSFAPLKVRLHAWFTLRDRC